MTVYDETAGHVLITGAGKRMGRALALAFADAGWFVTVHHNTSVTEARETLSDIRLADGDGQTLQLDLADIDEFPAFLEHAQTSAPPIDLLINNASLFEYDEAETTSRETLDKHLAINTTAPVLLSQLFARSVRDNGRRGAIINLLDNKIFSPNPDYFSYSISKYGLYGATKLMAMAFAPMIRVNAIAPGVTFVSGNQSDDDYDATKALNPLEEAVDVDDICEAALFLANAASVNGEIITIDGGQTLLKLERDVAFMTKEAT